ncbi:unnamed protein product [Mytilus coruscus]|uniref:Uncharacterized protein n=1 Tax=Mytilus coruscus TaxID=42192 RepID=A0A6J7ZUD4_MYTCO|nr:unnamed protein product [Mytilus coruscus]
MKIDINLRKSKGSGFQKDIEHFKTSPIDDCKELEYITAIQELAYAKAICRRCRKKLLTSQHTDITDEIQTEDCTEPAGEFDPDNERKSGGLSSKETTEETDTFLSDVETSEANTQQSQVVDEDLEEAIEQAYEYSDTWTLQRQILSVIATNKLHNFIKKTDSKCILLQIQNSNEEEHFSEEEEDQNQEAVGYEENSPNEGGMLCCPVDGCVNSFIKHKHLDDHLNWKL